MRTYRKYKEIEDSVFQALDLQGIVLETKSPVASSPLDNSQIEHYSEAIELLMNEKKLYIDPELSLKQLAAHVGLHANKLSWLLNNHFGNNFNDFINRFRIMEFQKMAIDPANKNLTLLGLAYDSGFNSKTVFNTFFKKETGMTPKQWVKQNTT